MASKGPMAPTNWIKDSKAFMDDVVVESRKIAWPNQKETVAGTVSVFVVVAIIAVALGVVDWALSLMVSQVLP